MRVRITRLTISIALLASGAALAGCGAVSGKQVPELSHLPLVKGSRVVAQTRQCDPGSNAYCALELVVVGARYRDSVDLLKSERKHLVSLGWTNTSADTSKQSAAESPGHKLRLTYATADGDLLGVELGWIKRPRTIELALSHALFERSAALSLMLELGPS